MHRLWNTLDALSQLGNAAFLPRAADTNANVSISGRCHMEGWRLAEALIDALLFWDRRDGKGHCALAVERDRARARQALDKSKG